MATTCFLVVPTREDNGLIDLSASKVFETEAPAGQYAIELVDGDTEYIKVGVLLFGPPLDGDAPFMVYGYSREPIA